MSSNAALIPYPQAYMTGNLIYASADHHGLTLALQAPPIARARHERRLLAVACKRLLGSGFVTAPNGCTPMVPDDISDNLAIRVQLQTTKCTAPWIEAVNLPERSLIGLMRPARVFIIHTG